jgi:hypothetical protein
MKANHKKNAFSRFWASFYLPGLYIFSYMQKRAGMITKTALFRPVRRISVLSGSGNSGVITEIETSSEPCWGAGSGMLEKDPGCRSKYPAWFGPAPGEFSFFESVLRSPHP